MPNLVNVWRAVRKYGPTKFAREKLQRNFPARATDAQKFLPLFSNGAALEIGGPSIAFQERGLFPVYSALARADNINFGLQTVWEGTITPGETFVFDSRRSPGTQFIGEASNLSMIADATYDAVLSSHTLEHSANPLKVLSEIKRILKPDGHLALILPHKDGTFDRYRAVTTLEHLVADYENDRGEDDLTHLDEILEKHDYSRSPDDGGPENFRSLCLRNFENRQMHHHVFTARSAVAMVEHAGFKVLSAEAVRPYNIVIIARRTGHPPVGSFSEIRSRFPSDARLQNARCPFPSAADPTFGATERRPGRKTKTPVPVQAVRED